MNSFLYPICAITALLAFAYKARLLRTDRSATQLFLIGNLLFLSIIFTVSTPSIWVATSQAVGIVNFSGLFTQSCVILMTACQQIVLLHLSHDAETAVQKARPRLIALGLVLAAMITLFSMATSSHENPTDFAIMKAQLFPAYLLVYLIAYGASQIDVGIMCWRYAKVAPTPWLRRGLFLVGMTMPFAMVYTLCRLADITAGQFGISGHMWEPVAQWSVAIASVINVIGWTLPEWGRHLSRIWQALDNRRAYSDLAPIHSALAKEIPEAVLPLNIDTALKTRLYRRVVEIRDMQWALRSWMHPAVTAFADSECDKLGLTGTDRAAVIEAAQLRAAVRAKARNEEPLNHDGSPRIIDPEDLASELAFQRQLADAFVSSPIARAAETYCSDAMASLPKDSAL
jgi:hypothetical protein